MQGLVRALTLTVAVCGLASGSEPCESAAQLTIATFESLDRNADRLLSRAEAGYDRILSAIFADSDVDGDGFLTPAEYARATGGAPVNL